MAKGFNHERAAMVLCDAVILGDRAAAEKWNITTRSIQNYRGQLENNEKLRTLTKEYREKQTEKWLEDIPVALSAAISFFLRATQELSTSKAEDVLAVVAVFTAIADMDLTQKVVQARLKDDV